MTIRKSSISGIPKGETAGRPSNPSIGDVFYNGTLSQLDIWDGAQWVAASAPPAAPTISIQDVGTGVAYASAQAVITFIPGAGGNPTNFIASASTGGYTASTNETSVNITVGTQGSWTFSGQAINNFGTSIPGPTSSLTLTTVPQAPTIGTTTLTSDAVVNWTLNSNGGKNLSSITVTPYLNGTTAGTPQNAATTSSTSMTFTGLTPGSNYTFTVKATNANGTSLESSASNSVTIPTLVDVEYLVIAGGGGGANRSYRRGGGGGGGGYRTGTLTLNKGTNFTATVGAGGAGNANVGNNSVFSSITSAGGGLGAYGGNGGPGGSGGGACGVALSESNSGGAASPAGQGFAGGNATTPGNGVGAGGGGGASAVGQNGNARGNGLGGNGGNGLSSSITGSSVNRGGGGGGGSTTSPQSTGGTGGGGAGSDQGTQGTGTANTGGGGGGSGLEGGTTGAGGSGVVILRYLTSGNTITVGAGLTSSSTTDGSYTIRTITAGTGNVSWA
jgi:hypothetical protein